VNDYIGEDIHIGGDDIAYVASASTGRTIMCVNTGSAGFNLHLEAKDARALAAQLIAAADHAEGS